MRFFALPSRPSHFPPGKEPVQRFPPGAVPVPGMRQVPVAAGQSRSPLLVRGRVQERSPSPICSSGRDGGLRRLGWMQNFLALRAAVGWTSVSLLLGCPELLCIPPGIPPGLQGWRTKPATPPLQGCGREGETRQEIFTNLYLFISLATFDKNS